MAESRLLLASRSATRQHMLRAAGVSFETVEAPFDEEAAKARWLAEGVVPRELAARLAEGKALSVSADGLILGADQVLERDDGSTLSKPGSPDEALEHLRSLSGRTHYLHSAAAMVEDGAKVWSHTESVTLNMRPLSDAFLADYIDREYEAICWSVGGYRIEGLGAQLFERVEGSHFAILGLPLLPLFAWLRERSILPS